MPLSMLEQVEVEVVVFRSISWSIGEGVHLVNFRNHTVAPAGKTNT